MKAHCILIGLFLLIVCSWFIPIPFRILEEQFPNLLVLLCGIVGVVCSVIMIIGIIGVLGTEFIKGPYKRWHKWLDKKIK